MKRERHSILILGAGVMQIPAISLAKNMGFTVLVADGNPDALGSGMGDYFEHVDLKDREGMLQVARRYRERGLLDGVFTAGTDFSATVAYVAEQLGLPGIPYEVALNASDKGRMRRVFRDADVPSPDFRVVSRLSEATQVADLLGFPLVVKPVDNMGSRGVRRVRSLEELHASVEDALSLSRTSRVILEEFIDGPEFSVDALVYRGEITICGLADRMIVFPPYFVEMGHTMPTDFPVHVQEEILDVFRRGVEALGIRNGAAKGDIKYSSHGPVIGEIAARLSGGYMSGWTFPYASGVHVTAGALRIAVGLDPGDLSPKKRHTSAERAFISIPGKVHSVSGLSEARSGTLVKELFLRVSEGDRTVFPRNNVEKCGNVITEGAGRADAVQAAEEACRKVLIRLEAGDAETGNFLYSADTGFPPGAYVLEDEENREALRAMPVFSGTGNGRISILPLPALNRERCRDWQGTPIQEALDTVLAVTGAFISGDRDDEIQLGRGFWKAFLRGGVQGGIWVIDTVMQSQKKGIELRTLFSSRFPEV